MPDAWAKGIGLLAKRGDAGLLRQFFPKSHVCMKKGKGKGMEKIREVFAQKGIQMTKQRAAVYKVLKTLNTHVTAEMVLEKLREQGSGMTVATVYNIMNLFEEKGLIQTVGAAGEPVIFDVNTSWHAHICDAQTRCVRDYPDQELMRLVGDYLQKHPVEGLELSRIEISLIGRDHGA